MLKVRRRNAYNLTFSHFHMLTRSVTDAALKETALGLKAATTTTQTEAANKQEQARNIAQVPAEPKEGTKTGTFTPTTLIGV